MIENQITRLLVGKINGFFGVKGWIKVFSYTEPKENIINYTDWLIKLNTEFVAVKISGRTQGKTIVAQIEGAETTQQVEHYLGKEIYINTSQLPILDNAYYYYQLEELEVINTIGEELGKVSHLFATGSNPVLVTKGSRERFIPFIKPYLVKVDLAKKVITVDWDKDF